MGWRRLIFGVAACSAAAMGLVTFAAERAPKSRLASLDEQSTRIETGHGTLEYFEWGEGDPLLILHGAGGGFDQGKLLADAIGGEGFRGIAISRFGYLGSDLPVDASTAAQADAIRELLDMLELQSVDVLAMSGGVPPALQFAAQYPDRTGRLVLLSSAPFTPFSPEVEGRPVPDWVYERLLASDYAYWVLTKVARRQLMRAFDARDDLREDLPEEELRFVDALVDGFLPASRRIAGVGNEISAVDPDVKYAIEGIEAPALIVHARDDALNPFEVAETLDRRLPRSRLLALDTGGHLLLGHHAQLRFELLRFLGRGDGNI